jgi:quinol monooxygenase YgiN
MPVAVRITPQRMSKQDYERLISELEASGVREPDGRRFHAAYGDDEVQMFEVWESPEQFEAYREKLFAALQAVTLGPAVVAVDELRSRWPS